MWKNQCMHATACLLCAIGWIDLYCQKIEVQTHNSDSDRSLPFVVVNYPAKYIWEIPCLRGSPTIMKFDICHKICQFSIKLGLIFFKILAFQITLYSCISDFWCKEYTIWVPVLKCVRIHMPERVPKESKNSTFVTKFENFLKIWVQYFADCCISLIWQIWQIAQ